MQPVYSISWQTPGGVQVDLFCQSLLCGKEMEVPVGGSRRRGMKGALLGTARGVWGYWAVLVLA